MLHQTISAKATAVVKQLEQLERDLAQIEQQERDATETVNRCRDEYMNLGGNRIDSLKKDIQATKDTLNRTNANASRYQILCRNLSIKTTLDEQTFHSNITQANNIQEHLAEQEADREREFGDCAIALNETEEHHRELSNEIEALKSQPNSNIPPKFNQLKDAISRSLGIDPNTLMYIGELVDIEEDEQDWQGAIE